ncbi:MAG TPA: hypothetical protein VHM20_02550 [Gammaproteobacteria bacterium]|jgi:ankyrin repeat protein|nr:hypothetical protein [Gammaproteobacteria bacterium]
MMSLPLHSAAKDLNLEEIKKELEKVEDINSLRNHLGTPLLNLVISSCVWQNIDIEQEKISNSLKIIKLILEKKANINLKDNLGQTPLQMALPHQDPGGDYAQKETNIRRAIINLLVQKGADTNCRLGMPIYACNRTTMTQFPAIYTLKKGGYQASAKILEQKENEIHASNLSFKLQEVFNFLEKSLYSIITDYAIERIDRYQLELNLFKYQYRLVHNKSSFWSKDSKKVNGRIFDDTGLTLEEVHRIAMEEPKSLVAKILYKK